VQNFIEIGQTSLEIGGCQLGLVQKKFNLFCHGQKCDYLSRDSQSARGATKKEKILKDREEGGEVTG